MFYYLANAVSGPALQSYAFLQRKIDRLTQTKIGDVSIFARATEHQLAYDGYKANIDVFCLATAMQNKMSTSAHNAAFPSTFTPTVPLVYPSIYFQFAKPMPDDVFAKFKTRMARYNFQEHTRGKQTIFTLEHPDPAIVLERIIPISRANSPKVTGYASLSAFVCAHTLYQIIDSFLSTHSYPYSRTLDGAAVALPEGQVNYNITATFKRAIAPEIERVTAKRARISDEDAEMGKTDEEESDEEDDDDDMHVEIPIFTEVLTAKPSPLPSSINYGSPAEVPALPGIAFPYFPGMLAGDVKFIKDIANRYFFRNLGISGESTQKAWLRFKNDVEPFTETSEGIIVSHIMKGMEMAIESQTQLFIVLDRRKYLGFCLLGGYWTLFDGKAWASPVEAPALAETVSSWTTHGTSLECLAKILSSMDPIDRAPVVKPGDINTSMKLAKIIGKTSFAGEEAKGKEKEVQEALTHLTFETRYKGIGPDTIAWALREMTVDIEKPLEDDIPVYFPMDHLAYFARKEFMVLCCFGSRTLNFFSTSGKEFKIPGPKDSSTSEEKDKDGKEKIPVIVISSAPPFQAYRGWESVRKNRSIRFDPSERSKESRCYTFSKAKKVELWKVMKETIGTLEGPKKDIAGGPSVAGGAKVLGFGSVDPGSFDWDD